ncbi:MAG: hypothetical protein ACJ8C4_06625 [Gemmataceae bacterium]
MSTSALCLHRGALRVSRQELDRYQPPAPTATWFPVAHGAVLETALNRLGEAGYRVRSTDLGVSQDGHRFFGTLDLDTTLAPGVSLAVGIRNSTDKTFPLGFCAGHRVFVCDNLAFRSELLMRKRHTRYGELRFGNAISDAVISLQSFAETETQRVLRMQFEELTDDRAHALILKAYLRELVSFKLLHEIVRQWEQPAYAEWGSKTVWRLANAFTWAMADVAKRNPADYATRTIRLNQLLAPMSDGDGPEPAPLALAA